KDHAQVIEIWNVVFIQFNRKKDGSLEQLPAKHVDTGMGFERLVRVLQGKQSNYDTDIFTGTIAATENITNKKYTNGDDKQSIAFRVIADHIRAIAFTIADGQLPSNTGAGYVIRRILRRAVRYYYSYLDYKQPLLHLLLPGIAGQFENVFPELSKQKEFISKVILEEENNFLRTLGKGIKKLEELAKPRISSFNEDLIKNTFKSYDGKIINEIKQLLKEDYYLIPINKNVQARDYISKHYNTSYIKDIDHYAFGAKSLLTLHGWQVFELFDTYGFPLDLIKLTALDYAIIIDDERFDSYMQEQKTRSRSASIVDTEDWITLVESAPTTFIGYTDLESTTKVMRYRKSASQGKTLYQLVLEQTPFYAESGGQVGDTGILKFGDEIIKVIDTKKENDLILHFTENLPAEIEGEVSASVDQPRRINIQYHHTATHLLHAALRKVLSNHVAQKGSLVNNEQLRFDFSHIAKMTNEEIAAVEKIVNEKIRQNIPVVIQQMMKDEAIATGAMALFGEKYGDVVRTVIIDPAYSIELCGGTHVANTGELGYFKIKSESAIGAGVRRIEAVSGEAAENYINQQLGLLHSVSEKLKSPANVLKALENLMQEKDGQAKSLQQLEAKFADVLKQELLTKTSQINGYEFIGEVIDVSNADILKKLALALKANDEEMVVVLAAAIAGKASVSLLLPDKFIADKNIDAPKFIKEHISGLIKGGGGGSKNLATAGGQDTSQLLKVIDAVKATL
ncbi:MAG: alanine--tRNA ligase-related protein, partial [Ginsengibacter sp.]